MKKRKMTANIQSTVNITNQTVFKKYCRNWWYYIDFLSQWYYTDSWARWYSYTLPRSINMGSFFWSVSSSVDVTTFGCPYPPPPGVSSRNTSCNTRKKKFCTAFSQDPALEMTSNNDTKNLKPIKLILKKASCF
jgi:hypothetical protein